MHTHMYVTYVYAFTIIHQYSPAQIVVIPLQSTINLDVGVTSLQLICV